MAYGQSIGSTIGSLGGSAAASLIPGAGPFIAPFASAAGGAAGGYLGGLFDSNGNSNMNQQNQQNQYPQGPYGVQRFSPEVQSQLMQLLQGGGAQGFQGIEQDARHKFNTQTIPTLAERFTAMGGSNRRSGGFEGAIGQAGAGLEQGLRALRGQHGLQLLQTLLPYLEQNYQQRQPGFGENFGVGAASSLGTILPLLFMYLSQQGGNNSGATGTNVTPNFNTGTVPQNPSAFNNFNLGA
jgi:hypothetical protein